MKSTFRYQLLFLYCTLFAGSCSLFAQHQSPGKPLGDYRQMKGAELIYLLPPLEPLRIQALIQENRDGQKKLLHYAIERHLQLSPGTHGAWTLEQGHRVWRVHLISPGALSLGVVFSEYHLQEGVKLMVYDPDLVHIKGAFTSGNNKSSRVFSVRHIPGDELIVELQVPDHLADFGQLIVGSVSHAFLPVVMDGLKKDGRFGRSQECEIDINCQEGNNWKPEHRSVVRIKTTEDYCSGVMLNNTAYNGAPLLLTAEHCFETRDYAATAEFVFDYQSPACFGGDGSVEMFIEGAEILAVADSIDFCLLKLDTLPPGSFGVFYAGWDLNGAHGNGTACIHHPEGDVMKISLDFQAPSVPGKLSEVPSILWDYYFHSLWWIKEWDIGSTEGGSSGSPLFNTNEQVIGHLIGGRARCGDSIGFDAENNRIIFDKDNNIDDYFTNLGVAWDFYADSARSLQYWLDPVNSGMESLEGYYPSSERPPVVTPGKQFILYPNPVSGVFHISASRPSDQMASFRVFDVNGKLLLEGEERMLAPIRIDMGAYQQGLFLVCIEAGGLHEVLKFIVAR